MVAGQPPVPPHPSADVIHVALQEWAVCCRALGEGRTILTVRKGGIHERGGGTFQPEHQRFALLPTHLHQDPARVRPAYGGDYGTAVADPPPAGRLSVALWVDVMRVWRVENLALLLALDDELIWTPDEVAARFAYRGQPFLFALALRVYRLPQPQWIPDDPAYAGCRSWIRLKLPIDQTGSQPVLTDADAARRLAAIESILA